MLIYNSEIPNDLIERYCRLITILEKEYSAHVEKARAEVHNEIFEVAGRNRSGVFRDDRRFITALNMAVVDLTCIGD